MDEDSFQYSVLREHKYQYGEIAQLARACGSYPQCRGFESPSRYYFRKAWFVFSFFLHKMVDFKLWKWYTAFVFNLNYEPTCSANHSF